jgi:predicted transcriptional regulator
MGPLYRISRLSAANQKVTSVAPAATLQQVTTLLIANNFSQLPVMTSTREVKGVVSWKSIGSHAALGRVGNVAKDFMATHYEVSSDASIFDAIPIIEVHDYILVRGRDRSITGIVTASDLSIQIQRWSEPFLNISEIENLLIILISRRFSDTALAAACNSGNGGRKINSAVDMNFGDYVRLLGDEDRRQQNRRSSRR